MPLPCYYYLCYYLATTCATTCAGIERKSKPVKGEGALHFDETLEFTGALPYHGEGHGLGLGEVS